LNSVLSENEKTTANKVIVEKITSADKNDLDMSKILISPSKFVCVSCGNKSRVTVKDSKTGKPVYYCKQHSPDKPVAVKLDTVNVPDKKTKVVKTKKAQKDKEIKFDYVSKAKPKPTHKTVESIKNDNNLSKSMIIEKPKVDDPDIKPSNKESVPKIPSVVVKSSKHEKASVAFPTKTLLHVSGVVIFVYEEQIKFDFKFEDTYYDQRVASEVDIELKGGLVIPIGFHSKNCLFIIGDVNPDLSGAYLFGGFSVVSTIGQLCLEKMDWNRNMVVYDVIEITIKKQKYIISAGYKCITIKPCV
jgi:WD40 repeat protein